MDISNISYEKQKEKEHNISHVNGICRADFDVFRGICTKQ